MSPFSPWLWAYIWPLHRTRTPMYKCRVLINIYSCFGLISLVCSECIFVLRTCALWNNNRILRVAMLTTFFAVITISAGLLFTGIALSHVVTSMIPGITGCYWSLGGVWYSISFVFLLICQLGLFSLTLTHVIQSWRTARGHLYSILVKHNIFYYACGVLLSAINVLTPLLFSDSIFHSFEDLEMCVLAILATRMHLYLWHNDQHVDSSGLQTFLSNTRIFVGLEPEVTEPWPGSRERDRLECTHIDRNHEWRGSIKLCYLHVRTTNRHSRFKRYSSQIEREESVTKWKT